MINPHWLSGAYIIENTALDYENDYAFGPRTGRAVSRDPLRPNWFHHLGLGPVYVTRGSTDTEESSRAFVDTGLLGQLLLIRRRRHVI
jgi:hypothetical protein